MKKIVTSVSLLLLSGALAIGQTTATNFTASDCGGASHTLFTELDAGKVVVLVWVMPCSSCISSAKAGYDVVQGYATSNPGRVIYWLADDAGNTNCGSLTGWATTNGIGATGSTIFGNAGNLIKESDYGGSGMPHVAVIAGNDHKIFYNVKNGSNDAAEITAAINTALATTGVAPLTSADNKVVLFPNPAKDKIAVNYSLAQSATVNIEITDMTGKKIKTSALGMQSTGTHSAELNFGNKLANGLYLLKLVIGEVSQTLTFTIAD